MASSATKNMSNETQNPRLGAVGIIARNQKLLVIRRADGIRAAGMLCFPGGGIEEGESESEALCRELREELDADIRPGQCVWRSVTTWGVDLAWWTASLSADSDLTPNPDEVADIYWHTIEEMAVLPDLLESNHNFLTAYRDGEFRLEVLER